MPGGVDCLEIRAHLFYRTSLRLAESISRSCPTIISRGWLSLGTPGPLDAERLGAFASVVERVNPLWISEPLGFSRTEEATWESNLPVCPDHRSLNAIVDHAVEVMDVCRKLLLLETTSSFVQARGSMPETDFLNQACEKAKCGLLLDVTALLVNAANHRLDPIEWLRQIEPRFILQLHVSGYSRRDNRCFDEHMNAIQEEVWELAAAVLRYCRPEAIVIEREGHYPPVFALEHEIARSREMAQRILAEIEA